MAEGQGKYASGPDAVARVLQDGRVYVVTIVEERDSVTRCQFARGTAHDFLAWVVAKGRTASLRVMDDTPVRGNAELDRALGYAEEFARHWELPDVKPSENCPQCGRLMSPRERDEQKMCNDCIGGAA